MAVSGSMATLDLTYNRIGDVGAKAVAEAVRASGSMANLCLDNNNIGAASKLSRCRTPSRVARASTCMSRAT